MRFHPPDRFLSAFADGELSDWTRPLVATHLQTCVRCRRVVQTTRVLGRLAVAEQQPSLPAALRVRIIESVAMGVETIIPVADPPKRQWGTRITK